MFVYSMSYPSLNEPALTIWVIQRRCFDNADFYRRWSDYKAGFGNFKEKSDFWIGNDAIHMLTRNGYNHMRIEMLRTDNELIEAEYKYFFVGDEHTEYNLTINGFTGLYGNISMQENTKIFRHFFLLTVCLRRKCSGSYHDFKSQEIIVDCLSNKTNKRANADGMKFTTIDADNDLWDYGICANICKSGWWFNFCTCGNINGLFGNEKTSIASEMRWRCSGSQDCTLKATRILIRP
ncbi:fibrinogen-like protein 1 [Saccostrea echinata]|uniref:fibrinogen-like protein 1 n=1 Tax=Saccostrea echinata TaxID=191078 RepID=UPI002A83E3FF|nr:fibrinogen-like protein 1 [Saccostrea echinata]